MDKNAIKKYAVWARRELIERVSQRALIYGITAEDVGNPNAESVSPVFSEDGKQRFYLPEGKWVHLLDGTMAEGGKWMEGTYDYFSLPLYVREGDPL